jgi:hypothetical protein
MTYKELQKTAKDLKLPYIGVPKAELEESIKNAQAPKGTTPSVPPTPPAIDAKPESTPPGKKEKVNTAIVLDGNREVRRYSADVHGPNFADLALQFIQDRKYTVKFADVKLMHVCPACGHKWND